MHSDPSLYSSQFAQWLGPMGSYGEPAAPNYTGTGLYGETWGGDGL